MALRDQSMSEGEGLMAGFFSYLMAPSCVTVRVQMENEKCAHAERRQSEENDAREQCSTYKSYCRKDEKLFEYRA